MQRRTFNNRADPSKKTKVLKMLGREKRQESILRLANLAP